MTAKAENKISEVTTEANTAINQTQNVAQDLLQQKDTQIEALTNQLAEYKNSDLGSKLFTTQNLVAEQKKEIESLQTVKTELERVLAQKYVITKTEVK